MRTSALLALALALLCPAFVQAQRGGRGGAGGRGSGGRGATATALPAKGVVITVHGELKELAKKSIVLNSDENQMMTLRRSSKTKFFLKDKEIKGEDIGMDSIVSVDASEDTDMKLLAVAVRVEKAVEKDQSLKKRHQFSGTD